MYIIATFYVVPKVSLSSIRNFFSSKRSADEGFLLTRFGNIWYQRVGEGIRTPLVIVHGGPGFPHNYLLTLKALSESRPVIFYDQFGCGRSSTSEHQLDWTISQFVDELSLILQKLAPRGAHVLGHSWGAVPALKVALGGDLVRALVLASPFLSASIWLRDAMKYRALLAPEIEAELQKGEKSESYSSPEFLAAQKEYYDRHVTGIHRFHELSEASRQGAGVKVYQAMWGPNEFMPTGSLRDCELAEKLKGVKVPTLFTAGRNDEASPASIEHFASLTPRGKTRVFELSAHNPHLSEPAEYVRVVKEFLDQSEDYGS